MTTISWCVYWVKVAYKGFYGSIFSEGACKGLCCSIFPTWTQWHLQVHHLQDEKRDRRNYLAEKRALQVQMEANNHTLQAEIVARQATIQ